MSLLRNLGAWLAEVARAVRARLAPDVAEDRPRPCLVGRVPLTAVPPECTGIECPRCDPRWAD